MAEKFKENEHVESQADAPSAILSASEELEKHEVTDVQQLKRRSPDEVCTS